MRASTSSLLLALLPALAAATTIPSYSGYSVVFSDDFWGEAGSAPDSSTWKTVVGDLNVNNELETYSSSNKNVQISGGGTVQLVPWKNSSTTGGWTSGRLESKGTVTPAAGKITRVEASIRVGSNAAANQQGIWPAFWMLGDSMRHGTAWPGCGELDILEQRNGVLTGYGTAHCGTSTGGYCNEPSGRAGTTAISGANGDWHIWSIVWDRSTNYWATETITWYLDGVAFNTLTGATLGDQATWGTLAHSPVYIILNVAVGGTFSGNPNDSTLEGYGSMMEVKYVAAYST